jgi:autotransporter translocation and assembly factor TamB
MSTKNSATAPSGAKGEIIIASINKTAPTAQSSNPEPKEPTTAKPIPLSVDVLREKADRINHLFDKEEKLTETLKSLKSFNLSADNTSMRLELNDTKGSTFKTHQPQAIAKVVTVLKEEAETKLKECHDEIVSLG